MNNYVVWHCHSDMSNGVTNIDSVTKYQDYINYAVELDMKSLAFSEHGSVFAWYEKKEAMEKAGLKYIHAEEFYVTEKINYDEKGNPIKLRDNMHCVLIAKNYEGVKEINRLATKSFNRQDGHYYYVPRIKLDDVINTSENIIVCSACLGGILSRGNEGVYNKFLSFMIEHRDRCFLEIQHHDVQDQKIYNLKLLELHRQYSIPLIAGTDTHALNEEHAKGRKILQLSKNICFDDEEGWDLTFKSYEGLCEAYEKQGVLSEEAYLEAIANTNHMADMVESFEMDKHTKYPHIYDNSEKTFKEKINQAYKNHPYLKSRYPQSQVAKKIKEEFAVYKKMGSIDFMLLETYLREWEKTQGIQCGYSRGSVSGSLIAYVLGITQMDSIKFDLNFFRFANPDRVTNADIDTDYCSYDREKVKYFLLHDRLALPNIKTSEIITFNTIAMKGAIKDVCRALNISLDEAQSISDAVYLDEKKNWVIDDVWRKKYPTVFEYVDIVSGTIVSIGSHPSGVLVSDKDIEADVGLCSLSTSDYPVSMLDMHSLDKLFYVKLDVLGLDNIGVINECCKMAGIERLTPDNVNLNDEKVWKSICDDTTLIFQWESDSAQAYLKKFMSDKVVQIAKNKIPNFSYIKWFSFGNGLIRPSCASYRDEVADGVFYDNGFKELNEFLSPEAGKVCMQETIMQFLVKFCGYSNAESDNVRRAIAKKKGTATLLPEIEQRFIEYSSAHYDITKEKCQEVIKPFLQIILDASSYGFSWNHSDAYSCIGYISGFLRYYYPLEFLAAAFNIFTDKEDKIVDITKYAQKIGIKILPPKFRHSCSNYQMDKGTNSIYKGLESIKYMNSDVADKLYEMRNDAFNSFIDFLKVSPLDSRQLEILIKLGFFQEFGKSLKLIKITELFSKYYGKKIIKKEKLTLPIDLAQKYAESETEKQFRFTPEGMNVLLSELVNIIPDTDIPIESRLKAEQEYLGYIDYIDPSKPNTAVILTTDFKYSPKLTIYSVSDGKTLTVKLSKKDYQNNPVAVGDMINYRIEKKPKWKKNEKGEWIQDTSAYDNWLNWYELANVNEL